MNNSPSIQSTAGAGVFLRLQHRTINWSTIGIALAVLLLSILLTIWTDNFLTVSNLLNVARQSSILGLMTIGLTLVLVSGQIDLSMGAMYSLGGVVTALYVLDYGNVYLGILVGLGAGVLFAIINGVLSAYFDLPAFIVTLGTSQVIFGTTLLLTGGANQGLFGSQATGIAFLSYLGQGRILDVPMQFIILCLIAVLAWLLLSKSTYGLRAYASGGSASAARLTGVNVPKIQLTAFIISGTLAAFAGVIALGFISSVSPVAGRGMEFDAFAAAVLGGASLYGGRGTIPGALLGALFLGILRNGLVLMNVTAFWQTVIIGLVTIAAVSVNRFVLLRSTSK